MPPSDALALEYQNIRFLRKWLKSHEETQCFCRSTFMHQQVPIRKRVELQFFAIGSSDLLQVVVCLRRSSSVIAMIVFLRASTEHACVLSALFCPCMYWKGMFVYGQQVWSRFKGVRQQCSQGSWGISCCMRQQWHGSMHVWNSKNSILCQK